MDWPANTAVNALLESSETPYLRCRIPSEVEFLLKLHDRVGWTPGAGGEVRPDPPTRAKKELLLQNLEQMWVSHSDYIFSQVFRSKTRRDSTGRRMAERPPHGMSVLASQPFPYMLPEGTTHLVFWVAASKDELDEEAISAGIGAEIDSRGGGEFVWYENPKMSMASPHIYHVQVFWREKVVEHLHLGYSGVDSHGMRASDPAESSAVLPEGFSHQSTDSQEQAVAAAEVSGSSCASHFLSCSLDSPRNCSEGSPLAEASSNLSSEDGLSFTENSSGVGGAVVEPQAHSQPTAAAHGLERQEAPLLGCVSARAQMEGVRTQLARSASTSDSSDAFLGGLDDELFVRRVSSDGAASNGAHRRWLAQQQAEFQRIQSLSMQGASPREGSTRRAEQWKRPPSASAEVERRAAEAQLCDMGFDAEQVRDALLATEYNVLQAGSMLADAASRT